MGRAITIRTDQGRAADLRRIAKQQSGRRTALRLLAIANAMEGMSRAQAARSVGIERQSLCDAIKRFNAEGIAGLADELWGRLGDDGGVKAAYRGGCPSLPEPLSESDTPCTHLPLSSDCVSPTRSIIP